MIGNLCDSFFYDSLFEILIYILTNDNVLIWYEIMDYEYILIFVLKAWCCCCPKNEERMFE